MKLIIQIPCYNEEKTLPITVSELPRKIEGIDIIETLIIDDGSTDRTIQVAREIDVDHIISLNRNKGLANAFYIGIERCLELGADIIVNTDGDNQYNGKDIPNLIQPVVNGFADVVIGDRQISKVKLFSFVKRKLQKIGSYVIRQLAQSEVIDTVSGFRAFSRDAAFRINIFTDFSYTVENIIQLGNQKLKIVSVPIRVNETLRESRLFSNIPQFLFNQLATIIRVYSTYRALRAFSFLGGFFIAPGMFGLCRFLFFYYYYNDYGGHIQSLIISAVLINIGFLLLIFGVIADLISNNRKLMEQTLYKIKTQNQEKNNT